MLIEQIDNDKKGYFKAIADDTEAGKMVYTWAGEGKLIIEHTEVNPEFRGQKIGLQLLMTAVNFAREKNVKILPLCPFAKTMFDRNDAINDVLF